MHLYYSHSKILLWVKYFQNGIFDRNECIIKPQNQQLDLQFDNHYIQIWWLFGKVCVRWFYSPSLCKPRAFTPLSIFNTKKYSNTTVLSSCAEKSRFCVTLSLKTHAFVTTKHTLSIIINCTAASLSSD